jgi:shikimate kinase
MNIVLIGFRATGKTTIGKALAKSLKYKYLSIDKEIKKDNNKSISAIVEEKGWEYFRKSESGIIANLKSLDNYVIDTGGGSILSERNRKNLKKLGIVVLFEASLDFIVRRISEGKDRPKLTGQNSLKEEVKLLLEERSVLYNSIADFSIDTSKCTALQAVKIIKEKIETI